MRVDLKATASIFLGLLISGAIQTSAAQSKAPDYQALVKKSRSAIVRIEATGQPGNSDKLTGTGFTVSPGGLIVTAAHVVIDPKLVADQQGHGVDVNLNVYTQTSLANRLEAVEVLESAFVN